MGRPRRRSVISLICRSIITAEPGSTVAAKRSSSISASMPMARSTRRNTSSFHARSLICPPRLSPRLNKTAGGIAVGTIAGRRLSKAGVLGVGVVAMHSQHQSNAGVPPVGNVAILTRMLSNAGVRGIGAVAKSYYPPQSQQSLQPAPPHSRDRGSSAPNRANTDDRRNRARQTPDRLQNGPLDLTRASKQTRPVDVRSTP